MDWIKIMSEKKKQQEIPEEGAWLKTYETQLQEELNLRLLCEMDTADLLYGRTLWVEITAKPEEK